MADGYLNFDTKINEKGFNDGISKLCGLAGKGVGSIAGIASKANGIFTALSGSVAGVIIKQSLGVVANMEQQVGGVETLFKDSANTVIANANKAYKTAGMSANNYMETVTSFSASLWQSLGGDTAKAASYADRAIVDMSDNANKMGTNMRDIQNAYQGFAKQNYTMLDNLKLGYGGTQEEMKRLISDASKMTDVQKELGVTVDASSLSFGNIVNAGKIIAIVSPDSAPVKRMVQKAREEGNAIDATQGRRTKAVLVMENSQLVLSALLPETIAQRAQMESKDENETA